MKMTGQRTRIGRPLAGLLTAAVVVLLVVLLAPAAAATPESDADGAITAAWQASGGATGPLGPKDGGVYPIGEGFAQNCAGGKIYFTPATGAHFLQGLVLQKYESLGGPADSDLGFPTIDEGPGRVGPDSRNATFSAADKPVIFWTPDTGARVVRGSINAAWDRLGGSAGQLGVPAEDEAYNGDVVSQKFTGGEVAFNQRAKTFTTVPPELAGQLAGLDIPGDATSAINAARRAAGGPLGPLGAKQGPQYPIGSDGVGQDFTGGKIFYSPATGANVVTGQVLAKYESVGGPLGDLGFPTTSEADGGIAPASRISTFAAPDLPVIFWTPDNGAVIVRGAMNAAWAKLGGATGALGAPVADQTESGSVITQRFTGGSISWNKATNTFTTEPAKLAASLAGLKVPGFEPPKAPQSSSDANGNKWFQWRWWLQWHWWWLPVIGGVLALLLILTGLSLWRRRRRRAAAPSGPFDGEPFDREPLDRDAFEREAPIGEFRGSRGPIEHAAAPAGEDHWFAPPAPWDRGLATGGAADEADGPRVLEPPADDQKFFEEQEDPDAIVTAPIHVQSDGDTPSGRHARIDIDEPHPGRPAIHLPLDDPHQVPEGYPVKADTRTGQYWLPNSVRYNQAPAEIWFVSEELAQANGFIKAAD